MDRISLYIFRNLMIGTLVAVGVLTATVWLSQSLRLLDFIVEGSAPIALFFQFVALSIPHLLATVAPLGMIAAVIFVYNRFISDSELVVMRAAGFSPWHIAKPAFMMATFVAVCSYALHLYISPVAMQKFDELQTFIQNEYAATLLREGQFNDLNGEMTVYFQDRDRQGGLRDVLIHDQRERDRPVTVIAERGALVERDGAQQVVLFAGQRQESNRRNHTVDTLHFEQYSVDLSSFQDRRDPSGWKPPRERFLMELLYPDMEDSADRRSANRLIGEGHSRLATPLLAFAFVAVGLGVLLSGEINRRGSGMRVGGAVAAIVLIQGITLGVENSLRGSLTFLPLLYIIPVAGTVLGVMLMYWHPKRRAGGGAEPIGPPPVSSGDDVPDRTQ